MPKIESLNLRVRDPAAQCRFYADILGMQMLGEGKVGYANEEANIRFLQTELSYDPQPHDLYWKIALAVPNIEHACRQLEQTGVDVSAPRQFEDVGYLAKFVDPEGFSVELIEHWFKGNRQQEPFDPKRLGGGAHLNLITLRTADIEPIERKCLSWGMTPLCIQSVVAYGFTLYFYGFTSEKPPHFDLHHVTNREWVYQRKYTVLEVQHVHLLDTVTQTKTGHAGYAGTSLSGLTGPIDSNDLMVY